jgi:hypothetical protein
MSDFPLHNSDVELKTESAVAEKKTRKIREVSPQDAELIAMGRLVRTLRELPLQTRLRVLSWAHNKTTEELNRQVSLSSAVSGGFREQSN